MANEARSPLAGDRESMGRITPTSTDEEVFSAIVNSLDSKTGSPNTSTHAADEEGDETDDVGSPVPTIVDPACHVELLDGSGLEAQFQAWREAAEARHQADMDYIDDLLDMPDVIPGGGGIQHLFDWSNDAVARSWGFDPAERRRVMATKKLSNRSALARMLEAGGSPSPTSSNASTVPQLSTAQAVREPNDDTENTPPGENHPVLTEYATPTKKQRN